MKPRRNRKILLLSVLAAVTNLASAGEEIHPLDGRVGYFADSRAVFEYSCDRPDPVDWSFSIDGRVLARGRIAAENRRIALPVQLPPVAEGVIVKAALQMGDHRRTVLLAPRDPFADRRQWLQRLKISLFDPAGRTEAIFQKADLPHHFIDNPTVLDALTEGVLVVGQGIAFDEHRRLGQTLQQVASRGIPVLILPPERAELPFGDPRPERVLYDRSRAARSLEPLFADDLNVAARFQPSADAERMTIQTTLHPDAWTWVRLDYTRPRGCLILIGYDLVGSWETSPAAGYLFRGLLEHLSSEHSFPQPKGEEP